MTTAASSLLVGRGRCGDARSSALVESLDGLRDAASLPAATVLAMGPGCRPRLALMSPPRLSPLPSSCSYCAGLACAPCDDRMGGTVAVAADESGGVGGACGCGAVAVTLPPPSPCGSALSQGLWICCVDAIACTASVPAVTTAPATAAPEEGGSVSVEAPVSVITAAVAGDASLGPPAALVV